MRGSCNCGANSFEVKAGVPMQRFYCHCLYCQQFVGRPYTDVTFVRAKYGVIEQFHRVLQCPRNLLSERLTLLVDEGILERSEYREPGSRVAKEYRLTRPRPCADADPAISAQ